MRDNLKPLEGKRCSFAGTFGGYKVFTRGGYGVERALFTQIMGSGFQVLTDHVWILRGVQINRLALREGEAVTFNATVTSYWKGYHGDRTKDYRLSRPSNFKRLAFCPGPVENAEQFTLSP